VSRHFRDLDSVFEFDALNERRSGRDRRWQRSALARFRHDRDELECRIRGASSANEQARHIGTCPFRKSYPDIMMMQPGQNGNG
jgi:hypothetical protein